MFGKFNFQFDGNHKSVSHIVSGLDESIVTFVVNRSPKANDLCDRDCISYYAVNGEIGVISKTTNVESSVFGAPASSKTSVIHFSPKDLLIFGGNPGILAYVLASSGLFADFGNTASELASLATMQSYIFNADSWKMEFEDSMLNQVERALNIHDQVVLACEANPFKLIASLYSKMDHHRRWDRSFTFGSSASVDRPFSLQLFRKFDVQTQSFLLDNQVRYFEFARENTSFV